MANLPSYDAVILIGHGGLPADLPGEWVSEFKRLESARERNGGPVSQRERELDEQIRSFPRTPQTDPYEAGLKALAAELAEKVSPARLEIAFNEFCAPSVETVIDQLVNDGAKRVALLTVMLTPGGYHSEIEIPAIAEQARQQHPSVIIEYRWPYQLSRVAQLLADQLS